MTRDQLVDIALLAIKKHARSRRGELIVSGMQISDAAGDVVDAILAEMAGAPQPGEPAMRAAKSLVSAVAFADLRLEPSHLDSIASVIAAEMTGEWNAACEATALACRQASNVASIAGAENVAQALAGAADIAKGARRPDAAPATGTMVCARCGTPWNGQPCPHPPCRGWPDAAPARPENAHGNAARLVGARADTGASTHSPLEAPARPSVSVEEVAREICGCMCLELECDVPDDCAQRARRVIALFAKKRS